VKAKRILAVVAVVGVLAVLAAVRVKRAREKASAPLPKSAPLPVRIATASSGRVEVVRHVLGTVLGMEETEVAPRVMGRILSVNVREGARVKQGDLLAAVDDREFQDAVAEAQAALAAAQVAYEAQKAATARDKTLFEAKAISREQWDYSRAREAAAAGQLESARRRLDAARTRLSYCAIKAPFDGAVTARLADPGDLAVPGKPILKMVRQKTVRVRAALPSADLPLVKVGQPTRLVAGGRSFQAPIVRVFPAMSSNHLTLVECEVTNPPPELVSGAKVGADVRIRSAAGLTVPADALLEGESGAWVYAVRDGKVQPRRVRVKARGLDRCVVEGELRAGERLVRARPSRLMSLAPGMEVVAAATNRVEGE